LADSKLENNAAAERGVKTKSDMKPREFWVKAEANGFFGGPRKSYDAKNFQCEGYTIHVREVLPGTVTITEDEFLAAYDRAASRCMVEFDPPNVSDIWKQLNR
jgi:hypothetical protein